MDARVRVGYPVAVRVLLALSVLSLGACSDLGPARLGEGCLVQADCVDGALCVGTATERGSLCMATCDPAEGPLCDDDDGSVCLPGVDGPTVCFLGGELAEGAACLSSDACSPGLVCVDFGAGEVSRCARACDARSPTCGGALLCVSLAEPDDPSANLGYCAVPEGT